MGTMHPIFTAALAPFAPPPVLNDDDIYVINLRTRTIVQEYGASSPMAQRARSQGLTIKPGHALVTGLTARCLGLLS